MNTREQVALQIGLLTLANIEQASVIEELKSKESKITIPGYETDQEGQGQPPSP